MTNIKENGFPLLIYDRTQFHSNNYHFSYTLYSHQELSHAMYSEVYDFEIFGPNGFFRRFKGNSNPEIEITLKHMTPKSQVELVIRNHKKKNIPISKEDLYKKLNKQFPYGNPKKKSLSILIKPKDGMI